MRQLTRKDRARIEGLAHAVEKHPELVPGVVEDYGAARAQVHSLRELLAKRAASMGRNPDEPGSKSAVRYRDGLAPYGTPDITGFSDGCVF